MKIEDIKVGGRYYVRPYSEVNEAEIAGALDCWVVVKYNWGSFGLCHMERVLCPVLPRPPSWLARCWKAFRHELLGSQKRRTGGGR